MQRQRSEADLLHHGQSRIRLCKAENHDFWLLVRYSKHLFSFLLCEVDDVLNQSGVCEWAGDPTLGS
jgi:hypothetical protein